MHPNYDPCPCCHCKGHTSDTCPTPPKANLRNPKGFKIPETDRELLAFCDVLFGELDEVKKQAETKGHYSESEEYERAWQTFIVVMAALVTECPQWGATVTAFASRAARQFPRKSRIPQGIVVFAPYLTPPQWPKENR